MGEDSAAIRQEIEKTRERMGETVDALSYKADVPARTRKSVSGRMRGVKAKIIGTGSRFSDSAPGTEDVEQAGKRAVSIAEENPLGLAIGAAAVGFVAGMLIPSTDMENERLGPVADQVKDQARQAGREAVEHGRQVAEDAVQKAQEVAPEVAGAVEESAQRHAEELKASAQDSAETVKQTAQR